MVTAVAVVAVTFFARSNNHRHERKTSQCHVIKQWQRHHVAHAVLSVLAYSLLLIRVGSRPPARPAQVEGPSDCRQQLAVWGENFRIHNQGVVSEGNSARCPAATCDCTVYKVKVIEFFRQEAPSQADGHELTDMILLPILYFGKCLESIPLGG